MELRRYEERDRAAVWRLHVEGLRETGTDAGDGPWDDDLRAIGAAYLMAGGEFLVGVLDGDVVAIGGLQRLSPHVAEVKRLRVDASVRRRGYGRMMLRRLEDRAGELEFRRLRLDTTVEQRPARRLYEAEGYVEVARRSEPSGQVELVLEKPLVPVVRVSPGTAPLGAEMVAEALEDD